MRIVENKSNQLAYLVKIADPESVLDEVLTTLSMIPRMVDTDSVEKVHRDVVRLFGGTFPGYKACSTSYHDLEHTLETFLTLARLIHGAHISGIDIPPKSISLGLTTALLHDIGYIQQEDDSNGTGAKYTLEHINRGIEFMTSYLPRRGFSKSDLLICCNMIQYTDTGIPVKEASRTNRDCDIVGKMLGVADLLGQMASRVYLEKLLFLYLEFEEAMVPDYKDEFDLLEKTFAYYEIVKETIKNRLDRMDRFSEPHFRDRWDIKEDLYAIAVRNNLSYLQLILDDPSQDYSKYLRRRGLVDDFIAARSLQEGQSGRAVRKGSL
jgi:hypothetical protein